MHWFQRCFPIRVMLFRARPIRNFGNTIQFVTCGNVRQNSTMLYIHASLPNASLCAWNQRTFGTSAAYATAASGRKKLREDCSSCSLADLAEHPEARRERTWYSNAYERARPLPEQASISVTGLLGRETREERVTNRTERLKMTEIRQVPVSQT